MPNFMAVVRAVKAPPPAALPTIPLFSSLTTEAFTALLREAMEHAGTDVDGKRQFTLTDNINLWVGRHVVPGDRQQMAGPYFANVWEYPMVSQYPNAFTGRDDGAGKSPEARIAEVHAADVARARTLLRDAIAMAREQWLPGNAIADALAVMGVDDCSPAN